MIIMAKAVTAPHDAPDGEGQDAHPGCRSTRPPWGVRRAPASAGPSGSAPRNRSEAMVRPHGPVSPSAPSPQVTLDAGEAEGRAGNEIGEEMRALSTGEAQAERDDANQQRRGDGPPWWWRKRRKTTWSSRRQWPCPTSAPARMPMMTAGKSGMLCSVRATMTKVPAAPIAAPVKFTHGDEPVGEDGADAEDGISAAGRQAGHGGCQERVHRVSRWLGSAGGPDCIERGATCSVGAISPQGRITQSGVFSVQAPASSCMTLVACMEECDGASPNL
jgi:hypothetical protein